MSLQVAFSSNVNRTAQSLLTPEVQIPASLGDYKDVLVSFTMNEKTASDKTLSLTMRYETYNEVERKWEVGGGIDWVGGSVNPKTGTCYRPSMTDSLDNFLGKKVRVSISIPQPCNIGFKIELI